MMIKESEIRVAGTQKNNSMKDYLQNLVYLIIQPLISLLIKLKITPNMVTTFGFIINIFAAGVLIYGAEKLPKADLTPLAWGGGLILFAGFFDIVDGRLARVGNMASLFGALYDSVLDRYSELIMFLGLCYFLVARHFFFSSLLTFIALVGSMMVSYIRARSEAVGVECKTGLMQRPERIVITGVSALICGIVSATTGGNQEIRIDSYLVAETILIFVIPMALVAILSNVTAINRLRHSKREINKNQVH